MPGTRVSITFPPPQKAFLERESDRLGIYEAEVVRRALDEYRERREMLEVGMRLLPVPAAPDGAQAAPEER